MIRRILYCFIKLVCLTAGLFLLLPLIDAASTGPEQPDITALPDYNYMAEVWNMLRESKFQAAGELCDDIIRHDLPGAEEAKAVQKLCDAEISGAKQRICRAANGFVTGSGNSIEEAGGAIISDLIIYGDIRDLALQGYYKITGRENDAVIVTLSSIGLATELACWADWMPAIVKAFRKTGVLTEPFTRSLMETMRRIAKSGKSDLAARSLFTDFSTLIRTNSFPRSSYILRYVDTPNDLAVYARAAARARSLPYLILKSGGENGAVLLRQYGNSKTGLRILRLCARKGPAGVHWLRSYVPYRPVKWGAHIAKTVYLNHAYRFLFHAAKASGGTIRVLFWTTGILLILIGLSAGWDLWKLFHRRSEREIPS